MSSTKHAAAIDHLNIQLKRWQKMVADRQTDCENLEKRHIQALSEMTQAQEYAAQYQAAIKALEAHGAAEASAELAKPLDTSHLVMLPAASEKKAGWAAKGEGEREVDLAIVANLHKAYLVPKINTMCDATQNRQHLVRKGRCIYCGDAFDL